MPVIDLSESPEDTGEVGKKKMNSVWDDDSDSDDDENSDAGASGGAASSAVSSSSSSSSASAVRKEEALMMKPPVNYTLESFYASRKGAHGRRESHGRFRSAGSEASSGGRAVKKRRARAVVVLKASKPKPKSSGLRGQPSASQVAQVNGALAAFGRQK